MIFSKEGAPRADGVRVTSFLPGASTPVCSPSLAAELGKSGAYDFTKATLLHDSGVGGWQRWFARAQVPLPRAFEGPVFEDFNLLRAAALAGQGIALSGAIIADDLRSERLVELSSVTVHDDCAYYLLDHQNRGSATARRRSLMSGCSQPGAGRQNAEALWTRGRLRSRAGSGPAPFDRPVLLPTSQPLGSPSQSLGVSSNSTESTISRVAAARISGSTVPDPDHIWMGTVR